ncbi:MAG: hypothetical protein BGN96_07915 [Bacteroidales bacterium 45-6]|nr:MAG: hypothetical protein BGN96_07915 [Bacteroidales bacterium 45-6]
MFRELYYWLYELLKKVKTNDNPGFNAFLGISSFQCFNILTLAGIANYFLALDISKDATIYFGVILYVSVTAVNFFTLFRKKEEIAKQYGQLPAKRQSRGKLCLWLYMLMTVGLSMYVIMYLVTPKY